MEKEIILRRHKLNVWTEEDKEICEALASLFDVKENEESEHNEKENTTRWQR